MQEVVGENLIKYTLHKLGKLPVKKVNSNCEDTTGKPVDYSYLPELVGHLLGLAHLEFSQLCTEVMEPLQLTPKQFVALEFISKNPCISQKNIAENIGTAPPVMVGILDTLSQRGLLERKRSPHDRREYYVQLTPKGVSMLAEIRRMAFEVEDLYQEKTGLTDKERATILPILRKITNR
jgi:DNA-binding MarR family transcriptional regulator